MLTAPDLSLFFIMVLFGCAYLVLKHLYFRPILALLADRERTTSEADELHARSLEEARVALDQAEARFAERRREAVRRREALRAEGRNAREAKLGEARKEAEKILSTARERLGAELPALRKTVAAEAETLSSQVVSKILGKA